MKTLASPGDLQEIQQRLAALTADDQRRWGRMSVFAMVCHVRDAFAMAVGERAAAAVRMPLPPPVLKWLALSSPMRWPHNVATVPELEPGFGAPACTSFASERQALLEGLNRFVAGAHRAPAHPFFGRMSMRDWLRWGYLHTDHHLRQFGR